MSADIKREGVSNMNKKLNLLVMLVSLLALSLMFGSCDNGTTGDGGGGGIGGPDRRSNLLGTSWGKQNGSYHVTVKFSDSIPGYPDYGYELRDGTMNVKGDYFYNGTQLDIGGTIVTATLAGSAPNRTLTLDGFKDTSEFKGSVYNGVWTEE
jgi:hypothetical protein